MTSEMLEDELRAVTRAGGYRSADEVIERALQVLLASDLDLRIGTAIELYRQGGVTLSRAAEIADMDLEELKERLAHAHIPIRVDETPEDIRSGADLIQSLRAPDR